MCIRDRAISAGVRNVAAPMKRHESFRIVVGLARREWTVVVHERLDAVLDLGQWTCKGHGHGGGGWALMSR
eukprot:8190699-Prorocentrum_lima.AAC.1